MSGAVAELRLGEIADRIARHLWRLEAEDRVARAARTPEEVAAAKAKPGGDLGSYYHATAWAAGAKVGVRYVSYQGESLLDRREALSYLEGLDGGFRGKHWAWLDANPLEPEEAADIRFVALMRHDGHFFLYGVTRRTDTRVYGRLVDSGGRWAYSYAFLPRSSVVRNQATAEDLAKILEAERVRDAAKAEAVRAFEAVVDSLRTPQE